jgi:hypothetical protein
MKMALQFCTSILLPIVVCCHDAAGQSMEPGTLSVDADTPVVEIGKRSAGRNFMRLPSLDFRFEMEAYCSADLVPMAMSLSIADTRKSLTAEDISAESITSVTLRIPAPQIGPVAVDDFCIETDESNEKASLTLSSVLSAQASLLCGNDADSWMIYASKSLDVTLLCTVRQDAQSAASR